MLFQCHQESTQFNFVLVLVNTNFEHNFKKSVKVFGFFLFNVRDTKTIVKL